ncbi:hydroxymethylglutaryl-CoA lyase [Propylenella binzhouense]|uniref:hydroxymethylglutaryl-CoA lyase n=1 Tax=Propylenella binzhouense TaxID=2555902 RepID=A0A964WRZ4_9HYPH|nr:hydroxymethylglutaryl-CoA lyase [Propylenella binzhouense]MYZ46429.1 hydroxymethylglutaryl-CoA lyase [Propylenella binzhouense]
MTGTIRIVEVGPRDGLQNEAALVSPQVRIAFVEKLLAAGLKTIEVGSFVSPRWVPQMAGTDVVLTALGIRDGVNFPVLVPNEKGLDAALAAGAREIAIFTSASEAFSQKNINCSIAESIDRFRPVAERAHAAGIRVRGYVSCVLGCPSQGQVPPGDVVKVAAALAALGCYEISLGDTIGTGTPKKARDLVRAVSGVVPIECIAAHFHDTYGQALANLLAVIEDGVQTIDAAAGGLGGCPYAKGASGNVATEAVVYMLDGLGMRTDVNLSKLLDAVAFISGELGRPANSNVYRARRLSS